MKIHSMDACSDQSWFFKVKLSCCEECPSKLRKGLLKVNGVVTVSTDAERNLVIVSGKIDPNMLIKVIAKMGKRAELVSYQPAPEYEAKPTEGMNCTSGGQCCGEYSGSGENLCRNNYKDSHKPENYVPAGENIHGNKYRDCHKPEEYMPPAAAAAANNMRRNSYMESHKPEEYVPVQQDFGEDICRDKYCRIHRRNRAYGDNFAPSMFRQHPRGNAYDYTAEQYGPSLRPNNYWFHPRPGFDGFNCYSRPNDTGSCIIM